LQVLNFYFRSQQITTFKILTTVISTLITRKTWISEPGCAVEIIVHSVEQSVVVPGVDFMNQFRPEFMDKTQNGQVQVVMTFMALKPLNIQE
jgi:hypothetical protein